MILTTLGINILVVSINGTYLLKKSVLSAFNGTNINYLHTEPL
jgi:hypothetical protein